MLEHARGAILRYLGHESPEMVISARMKTERHGVFVTLRHDGELRGCIGYIEPIETLHEAVCQLAIKAATEDSRFAAIHDSELGSLVIEISVLTPLERCPNVDAIEIGRHGLVVEKEGQRGLLLPEVASNAAWNARTFVEQCCVKAGLTADAWNDPRTKVFTFETQHFSSQDTTNVSPGKNA